jgi:DNA-binding MarR family transcriptional regulator
MLGTMAHQAVPSRQVDAVLAAARGLVGVIAASFAAVEERVSLPQLRVLVLADADEPLSLAAVGALLGVHASNATRICDRLVLAGLLQRRDNPANRRQVQLTLTQDGRALLAQVMNHRRAMIEAVLAGMPATDREAVAHVLGAFGAVAHQIFADNAGDLAWS